MYYIFSGSSLLQISVWFGVIDQTIYSLKKTLRSAYDQYVAGLPVFLGGSGIVVEADETVLSGQCVKREPTSTDDERRDTVCILGAIDEKRISS